MSKVYFSIGANLGDRVANIEKSISLIIVEIGQIISRSTNYKTKPSGFESDNVFINIALVVDTNLSPREVLDRVWAIEESIGRVKNKFIDLEQKRSYSDRLIDIDILFYDNLTYCDEHLIIPHPHICKRSFVLEPLCEIAPNFVHPTNKLTIEQLKQLLWKNS